jgi:hypothetical protein
MLEGAAGHEEDIEHFRQLYATSIDYPDRKVAAFVERRRAARPATSRNLELDALLAGLGRGEIPDVSDREGAD